MSAGPLTPPPPPPPPSRWESGRDADEGAVPLLTSSHAFKRGSKLLGEYRDQREDGSCFCFTHPLAALLCFVSSPLLCTPACGSPLVVNPREEAVVTVFGRYFKRLTTGLYFVNPCGREVKVVSTQHVAHELTSVKVADGNGNPLHISGVVTYRVIDTPKAALDIQNVSQYISKQAHAVLKRVASRYPYEAQHGEPSLKTEVHVLQDDMKFMLQERVDVAGLLVESFDLIEIAYSPEIAPAMLVRQQAQALVDARTTIVAGAVQIASGALDGLADRGVALSDPDKGKLINNLLTVICGEQRVQPVLPISLS